MSSPNLLIAPTYTSRGPGCDGVNMHATSLCEVMIKPRPPEISHVSVPALVLSACAMVGTGSAAAAAIAKAARPINALCIRDSLSSERWAGTCWGTKSSVVEESSTEHRAGGRPFRKTTTGKIRLRASRKCAERAFASDGHRRACGRGLPSVCLWHLQSVAFARAINDLLVGIRRRLRDGGEPKAQRRRDDVHRDHRCDACQNTRHQTAHRRTPPYAGQLGGVFTRLETTDAGICSGRA